MHMPPSDAVESDAKPLLQSVKKTRHKRMSTCTIDMPVFAFQQIHQLPAPLRYTLRTSAQKVLKISLSRDFICPELAQISHVPDDGGGRLSPSDVQRCSKNTMGKVKSIAQGPSGL